MVEYGITHSKVAKDTKMLTVVDISDSYSGQLRALLRPLSYDYPDFWKWFNRVCNDELNAANHDRKLLLCEYQNELVGVAILKRSESKICTLFVDPKYRGLGVGTDLLRSSMEEFETDTPLITVSDNHVLECENLFQYFGFKLDDVKQDYYRVGHTEYVFNGVLQ